MGSSTRTVLTGKLTRMIARCVHTRGSGVRFYNGGGWILDLRPMLLSGPGLDLASKLLLRKLRAECQIAGYGVSGALLVPALVMAAWQVGKVCNGLIIRKEAKPYGRRRQIEGDLKSKPVVVVDDVVNSGRALFEAISILQEHGLKTRRVITIVNFDRPVVREWLKDESISFDYLVTLSELRSIIPALRKNVRQ